MTETVLVTGAGGFVGSAVVRHLVGRLRGEGPDPAGRVELGGGGSLDRVVALLRPGGDRTRLAELGPGDRWRVVEADLQRPDDVRRVLGSVRPRMVVHAALDRRVHDGASEVQRERWVLGPLRALVGGLSEVGGSRFVHAGSAWVLPGGRDLGEATSPEPLNAYACAKLLEDRALPELAGEADVEWIDLRLFNLFGRYEAEHRLIPYLVRRLSQRRPAVLSAGDNVRDFTDVALAAVAFERALEAPAEAADALYHVGTGRGTRISRMARWVAGVVGGEDLLRFGARETPDRAVAVQVADIGRARERLGWSPPDDLKTRVQDVAAWWARRLEPTARSSESLGRS